jgi:hypothetical protein
MAHFRRSALAAFVALTLAGCSKGKECDVCGDISDCESGLTCERFRLDNGSTRNACARTATRSCSFTTP